MAPSLQITIKRGLKDDMAPTETIQFPEWTELKKKNGLDPLGMQNSSVMLYQSLIPGISNVTLRVRYYGFYAWLSKHYALQIRDTDPKSWQRFLRRAEALLALVSQHNGGETGIAGTEWASRALKEIQGNLIDFTLATEPGSEVHYLRQAWGAYGAAYGGQLFNIGVLDKAAGHEIAIPSEAWGEPLAEAYSTELGVQGERFLEAIRKGSVTLDELSDFSIMLPSQIDEGSVEHQLYEALLFAKGMDEKEHVDRALTLRLVLAVTDLLRRVPTQDELRWVLYANQSQDGSHLTLSVAELESHRSHWWNYHANDLCHYAYESLLKFSLDILERHPSGIPMGALIAEVVTAILSGSPTKPTTWAEFIQTTQTVNNAYAAEYTSSEWSLTKTLRQSTNLAHITPPASAWAAIRLLATLQKRASAVGADLELDLQGSSNQAFQSLFTEIEFLQSHVDEPIEVLLAKLIEERILRRHLWVALRKFRHQRDYTFLVETDDGKVKLRQKDGPTFTTPRLAPALTFLKDIHLIGEAGISKRGKELLNVAL